MDTGTEMDAIDTALNTITQHVGTEIERVNSEGALLWGLIKGLVGFII